MSDLPYAACKDFTLVDVGRRLLCLRSEVWIVEGLNLGLRAYMWNAKSRFLFNKSRVVSAGSPGPDIRKRVGDARDSPN